MFLPWKGRPVNDIFSAMDFYTASAHLPSLEIFGLQAKIGALLVVDKQFPR
jgi:hypothetical protein